ncbi:hypothetical protein DICSQDRAFT_172208 [Dichomitus squalens LYAD-421 SS1]|uniref:DUF6589 domain-containing protein n=1 Tax=Dichomitus squalens (strain LYAD-421) TaxID=732165 RepID=R7SSW5_DICSQ|nr:uncharacterized protein DICSQDRAFT_172208 [Dichomitus squalens LYAD-421 SS1]EJF59284.1 hypothetical protein DICSQDRAFT_172208 [Dichomitus squalens LYAD-421 SS1]
MRANKAAQGSREKARAFKRETRKENRIGFAMTTLLGERSQNNSLARHLVGLYMYVSGASRQLISIMSNIGTIAEIEEESDEDDLDWKPASDQNDNNNDDGRSESETTIDELGDTEAAQNQGKAASSRDEGDQTATRKHREESQALRGAIEDTIERPLAFASEREVEAPARASGLLSRGAGLLRRISESCRHSTRVCRESTLLGHVYDNINMVFKVAEQILGRKDTQENGTCATVFPLDNAAPDDLKTADLLAAFDSAGPLSVGDICHTPHEAENFRHSLEHALLRTIVNSSDLFARFRPDLDACLPGADDQMRLQKTDTYPLPAMNIDKSNTTGNAEVLDTMFAELEYARRRPMFAGYPALTFGDQLSIARMRTIIGNRAGHEDIGRSYANIVFGPGFFHHQMAITHGIIETHFGDPTAGHRNPASLSFFNTVLDCKPIVTSSLPPYRVCRDLIFTVLTASTLHCLELVSGVDSLDKYTTDLSFSNLQKDVTKIYDRYVGPNAVAELRLVWRDELAERMCHYVSSTPPNAAPTPPVDPLALPLKSGDMVFENVSLFLRDALVFHEFTDAIKGGYSGRIICTLKILTLMYRGSGRLKYAHECLHLIHNLTRVWPAPLRAVMINNWLVNPTGKPNAWVPVDLLQEHMNFWVKVIYKAQGSNASWEWLQTISPCISVFRQLALQMNDTLGARLGNKHQSPSLHKDIDSLTNLMRNNSIFRVEPGHVLHDMTNTEVPNIVAAGLKQLPGPLLEYNKMFKQWQRRRRETPLTTPPASPPSSRPSSLTTVNSLELSGVVLPDAHNCAQSMPHTLWTHRDEEDYWQHFDTDEYEPRAAFAEEEDPSLDIDDW